VNVIEQKEINFPANSLVLTTEAIPTYSTDHLPWVPSAPLGPEIKSVSVSPVRPGRPELQRIFAKPPAAVPVLAPRDDIRLQLYEDLNSATKEHVGYRLRYLRRNAAAQVVADVMLVPSVPGF
jgi:hypothetical protein